MAKRKHSDLVNACLEVLRLRGCVAYKVQSGKVITKWNTAVDLAPEGTADITACLPGGRYAAIECKLDSDRLSKVQANFMDSIRLRGGIYLAVWNTVDDLLTALEAWGVKWKR